VPSRLGPLDPQLQTECCIAEVVGSVPILLRKAPTRKAMTAEAAFEKGVEALVAARSDGSGGLDARN